MLPFAVTVKNRGSSSHLPPSTFIHERIERLNPKKHQALSGCADRSVAARRRGPHHHFTGTLQNTGSRSHRSFHLFRNQSARLPRKLHCLTLITCWWSARTAQPPSLPLLFGPSFLRDSQRIRCMPEGLSSFIDFS